jgi:uncharacterized protein YdaU (DUF1376 family)
MADFPSLPLWTDSYMSDTAHLTDAEHGIYLQLLIIMWRNPDCRVPDDHKWIARKMRRSVDDFERDVLPIIQEFCQCDGNWITQKRLMKEWNYCKNRSKAQSDRANSRWLKEKDKKTAGAASGDMPPSPHPHPSPKDKEKEIDIKKNSSKGSRISKDWKVTREDVEYARGKGFSDQRIISMAEEHLDYWLAATGAKAVKKDWAAVWRTWVRRDIKFNGPPKSSTPTKNQLAG